MMQAVQQWPAAQAAAEAATHRVIPMVIMQVLLRLQGRVTLAARAPVLIWDATQQGVAAVVPVIPVVPLQAIPVGMAAVEHQLL